MPHRHGGNGAGSSNGADDGRGGQTQANQEATRRDAGGDRGAKQERGAS